MGISSQLVGQIAGILALLSVIPYLVSIFQGKTKPSRAAYAIWLTIDVIITAGYVAAGARSTAWVFVAFTLTTIVIFLLSLKYGMGGFNKFDLYCFAAAALIIVVWINTGNPLVALYMGLSAKMIGYLPVIKKSYLYPKTENTLSWAMAAVASLLNLFALTSLQLSMVLAPLSTALADTLIASLLLFPSWRFMKDKNFLPVPQKLKDY